MSGYIPRHSRAKKEPEEQSAQKILSELIEQEKQGDEQEAAIQDAQQVEPESTSKSIAKGEPEGVAESTAENADEGALQSKPTPPDDELLFAILDADKEVRENPELANPVIVAGEIPNPEADKALAKIRKRRWPITIAIVLAVVIIGGAITYYVLSSQALEREANRTAAYALLDEAIALVQESDQVVVSLDTATTTEVTEANLSEREVLLERVPTTLETLASAEENARAAVDLLVSEDDITFAQHVIDAAVNRKDMLTSGQAIITEDIRAMNAALLFGQAWTLMVDADTELRETTELSKTGGYNELREAIDRNEGIIASLESASELLLQAQESFVEADFSSVITYVLLKKDSVQIAIDADQAILNGDLEGANEKNTEFGLKDAAVVDAAGRIPAEPLTLITDAYEALTSEHHAVYASARANAAAADGHIREYVGVETQTGVQ